MTPLIIIPGWRDSGPGHWQSLWAEQIPGAVRVQQDDWLTPARDAWVSSIGRTILAQDQPVVLVAHSLGCIAAAHLLESGFGPWPLGLVLLNTLISKTVEAV